MPALISGRSRGGDRAGLVATLANPLPYKLGLMLGGLAGIAAGLLLDEWKRRQDCAMNIALMILGMALINLAIRYPVFLFADHVRFPRLIERAPVFVPVAVLTAIIVP